MLSVLLYIRIVINLVKTYFCIKCVGQVRVFQNSDEIFIVVEGKIVLNLCMGQGVCHRLGVHEEPFEVIHFEFQVSEDVSLVTDGVPACFQALVRDVVQLSLLLSDLGKLM